MSEVVGKALVLALGIAILVVVLSGPVSEMMGELTAEGDKRMLSSFAYEVDSCILAVIDGGSTVKVVFCPGVNLTVLEEGVCTRMTYEYRNSSLTLVYPVRVELSTGPNLSIPKAQVRVAARRDGERILLGFEVVEG